MTKTGQRELHRFLAEETIPLPTIREPFLVQLYFGAQTEPEHVHRHLLAQKSFHEARLRQYESAPLPRLDSRGMEPALLYPRMTVERGILAEKAALKWIELCLAHVPQAK